MKTRAFTIAMTLIVGAYLGAQNLEPVFPVQIDGLVWVEAEQAVTTNFADQATLDYGSSAYRLLLLNREGQSKSAPFYAEYSFVVPASGPWQLWLGGTPPGPQSDLLASFVSPLGYRIDGGPLLTAYREETTVNEKYSTNGYWYFINQAQDLSAGVHTIRLEIHEPRRYDSRYYFGLDALFLLREGAAAPIADLDRAGLPERFPRDMADRTINTPYQTIPQYEYAVQQNPQNKNVYLLLAQVYTLIGDYGNAIKTLSRARIMAGEDIRFTLLAAKCRLWSGEIDEGLRLYREYLNSPDADPAVWAEAAKINAWLMKYQDAEALYLQAMERYPEDLNLKVNYALTLLWQNKSKEGEQALRTLFEEQQTDPAALSRLAGIYDISGYPDKAADAYDAGIQLFPDQLDLYVKLIQISERSNKKEVAAATKLLISQTFAASDRIAAILAGLDQEARLREDALEAYRRRLLANPDDLNLRQELVRAYYWNGMLPEALAEANNILVNKLYASLGELDTDLAGVYALIDQLRLLRAAVAALGPGAATAAADLQKALDALKQATAQNDKVLAKPDPAPREKAAADLAAAQEALTQRLGAARALRDQSQAVVPRAQALLEQAASEAAATAPDAELLEKVKPWFWSAEDELRFLDAVAGANTLANYGRLRIGLLHEKPLDLSIDPAAQTEAVRRLLGQARLWTVAATAVAATPDPDIEAYVAADPVLRELAASLSLPAAAAPVFSAETPGETQEVLRALSGIRAQSAEYALKIDSARADLLRRARIRLGVRMYEYDTNTVQDRRDMSDVYLRLERPEDAVAALDRVLRVNPGDTASLFTLGRAMEMSGDWHGAMARYRDVYELNPRYENAAASYNRLAGVHTPVLETSFSATVDANRSTELSRLAYSVPLGSFMELAFAYTQDHDKIHQPAAGEFPVAMTLHTLDLRLPLKLPKHGLSLYAAAGGTVHNKLDDLLPPSVLEFDDYPLTDYVVTAPRLGAGLAWNRAVAGLGTLTLGADYRHEQVRDTFFTGRFVYYEHVGAASAGAYVVFPYRNLANTLSVRANFEYESIYSPYIEDDTNAILEAGGELHVGNVLYPRYRTLLDLGGSLLWQDAQTTENIVDYFAPDEVLTAKGGLALSSVFGLGGDWDLALSGRFWPGLYQAAGEGQVLLDGGLKIEGVHGSLAFYLDLGGYRTDTFWSATAVIGARLRLADYLKP